MSKGFILQPVADCYRITTPRGNIALCNLRWKTKPVWGKVSRRWEWSIPKRDYDRYCSMGVKYLFVFEKSTNAIHVASMSDIRNESRLYMGDDLNVGGTVFLPVHKYKTYNIG